VRVAGRDGADELPVGVLAAGQEGGRGRRLGLELRGRVVEEVGAHARRKGQQRDHREQQSGTTSHVRRSPLGGIRRSRYRCDGAEPN
jgi:hypothetical protein